MTLYVQPNMGHPVLRLIHSPQPLAQLLPNGRLVELSGTHKGPSARTTTAVSILAHNQQQGETAVWVQPRGGSLYPPDLAAAGIDLDALVVVHIPISAGPHGACKAAELLLRSGAFGLVVLDLCAGTPPGNAQAWQGRLLGLARQHHAQVVLLTEKTDNTPSLGPLIGVRIASRRDQAPIVEGTGQAATRRGPRPHKFTVRHTILKNKTGSALDPTTQVYRGPPGL